MYICVCKGITEKQVQDALNARNSNNPKEILKSLGVGSDCGTCVEDAIKNILEQSSQAPANLKDNSNKF